MGQPHNSSKGVLVLLLVRYNVESAPRSRKSAAATVRLVPVREGLGLVQQNRVMFSQPCLNLCPGVVQCKVELHRSCGFFYSTENLSHRRLEPCRHHFRCPREGSLLSFFMLAGYIFQRLGWAPNLVFRKPNILDSVRLFKNSSISSFSGLHGWSWESAFDTTGACVSFFFSWFT